MAISSREKKNIIFYVAVTAVVGLATYLFLKFWGNHTGAHLFEGLLRIPWLVLLSLLVYVGIRVVNALLFDFAFRLRRGYEAPTLVRNIFTLILFAILFVLLFNRDAERCTRGDGSIHSLQNRCHRRIIQAVHQL